MTELQRIKIGLDFHGVITDNPEFFSAFTAESLRRGYEIHIITGGPAEVVRNLLDDLQISYTTIFAILDFYEHLGKVKYFANGEFKVEEALWNSAKAKYCEENGIDFHIDDSETYVQWFSTPYCCYNKQGKECFTQRQKKVSLGGKAANALDEIEQLVRHQSRLAQA